MKNDLCAFSAAELLAAYRARTLSPVEATRAALARIAKLNPVLNCFNLVDDKGALESARASEARWKKGAPAGLLDGVPTSIKDILLTKGWPTLRGSKTVDPKGPWNDDAPAVARLREHGAVFLGKTTTPEFGWKGVTDSPLTGITRNPWNTDMTPGGSSGGAAAAAVTGMGALHIGTDGGGSVRIPAGLTGLFGMKATYGVVPAWPPSPFGTLANVGPMTRTVGDGALMLSVLAQPDPRDWYALPPLGRDFTQGLDRGVEGLKIAYAPAPGGVTVEPDIAAHVESGVKLLEELGANVERADPPIEGAGDIFTNHWFAGAAYLARNFTDEQKALMDPGLVACIEIGDRITRADYVAALDGRQTLGFALHAFMNDFDLLVMPTLPVTAFEVGELAPKKTGEEQWVDWTPWTYPFNLSRQPAATVPCGVCGNGLPAGLQIIGSLHDEETVLRAAAAFEAARPWALPEMATT